jgi:hypothetical protein
MQYTEGGAYVLTTQDAKEGRGQEVLSQPEGAGAHGHEGQADRHQPVDQGKQNAGLLRTPGTGRLLKVTAAARFGP